MRSHFKKTKKKSRGIGISHASFCYLINGVQLISSSAFCFWFQIFFHIIFASFVPGLSEFDFTNFKILEPPAMSTAPEHFLFCFHFFFPKLSNTARGCTESGQMWQQWFCLGYLLYFVHAIHLPIGNQSSRVIWCS